MATQTQSVQFAGGNLGGQRYICAFFNSTDEEHRVLGSFIKDGFARGDKAFHLVNPELREEHLKRLADAGINVQEAMGTGQLEVRPWQDGPLHGGRFDQDTWLLSFEQVLQSGPAAGYADKIPGAHGMGAGRLTRRRRPDRVRDAGQLRGSQVRRYSDLCV